MIAPLKKIFLLAPSSKFNSIFSFLQKKGILELADSTSETAKKNKQREDSFYNKTARRIEDINDAINFLGDGKIPLIKGKTEIPGFDVEKIILRSAELKSVISQLKDEIAKNQERILYLSGIISMGIPFDKLEKLTKIKWKIFSIPEKKAVAFEMYLSKKKEAAFEKLPPRGKEIFYVILFPQSSQPHMEKFKGMDISIPSFPRQELEKIKKEIPLLKSNLDDALGEKMGLSKYLPQILLIYDYYGNVKIREENRGKKIFETGKVFVLSGFLRDKDLDKFRTELFSDFPYVFMEAREPLPGENVPVSLDNGKFAKSYEAITSMYGTPEYCSIDPSPNIAVFFAFFWGLCLTDAAYGIIISIASFLILASKKVTPAFRKILKISLACGLFTTFAGAATGGWFGDLPSRLSDTPLGFLKTAADKIVVFNPVKDALLFVGISIACGFAQVMWGMILKCVDDYRRGSVCALIFEDIASICIEIALPAVVASFALGAFSLHGTLKTVIFLMFAAGSLSIVFYNLFSRKGFIFKILWSYYGLYSVITGNAFSDVLSYVRLFALGLTTGLVATAINEGIWIIAGWGVFMYPVAAFLFVFFHILNIALNMLGASVHTLRLQYYEFFTKFIRTGGHYFNPLKNFVKYSSSNA